MAKQPQEPSIDSEVPFPVKGLSLGGPFHQQEPLTTPDAENVRAFDPQTDRNRGAQRCGLTRYCPDQLATKSVQEIIQATSSPAAGTNYSPGSGDVFIPFAGSFVVLDVNGAAKRSYPSTPRPRHSTFDQDGNEFVAVPGPGGFPVRMINPQGQMAPAPGWGQPGGGAAAGGAAAAQAFDVGKANGVDAAELRVDNVDLAAGDVLIAITGRQGPVIGPTFTVTFKGEAMTNRTGGFGDDADYSSYTFDYRAAGAMNGDVVATPTAGGGPATLIVIKLTGLANGTLDRSTTAVGTSTTPSSGAAAATTVANEIIVGIVATKGPITDTVPTWTNLFTLTRDGTDTGVAATNATVAVSSRGVFAVGAFTAAATGITSRSWFAHVLTYS